MGSHVHTYPLQKCGCGEVIQNPGYFWLLHLPIIFDACTDYSINFDIQLFPQCVLVADNKKFVALIKSPRNRNRDDSAIPRAA